jgi:hypothetical protein
VAARGNGYTIGHLSNVEAGRREATPGVVLAYARVLAEDCMKRRGLLGVVAAGVVAPAAAGELIHEGFTAALARRGADDKWRARVIGYGRDYMAVGAGQLQTRLAADLVLLQQQVDTSSMWASASRLLAVYGKTTGEPREAIRWYRLALEAADRSDDLAVRVWVRGRAAIALAYEGAALGVAADFAEQAVQLSDRPSIGRLNALMAQAHVAAGRGDLAGAAEADEATRWPPPTPRCPTSRFRRGGWRRSGRCCGPDSVRSAAASRPRTTQTTAARRSWCGSRRTSSCTGD